MTMEDSPFRVGRSGGGCEGGSAIFFTTFFPEMCATVVHEEGETPSEKDFSGPDLYFAWGLLMDPHFIRELTGRFVSFSPAVLPGYRRSVKRQGDGWSFVLEPDPRSVVQGVVLMRMTASDIAALDRFEETEVVMDRYRARIRIGDLDTVANIYLKKGSPAPPVRGN